MLEMDNIAARKAGRDSYVRFKPHGMDAAGGGPDKDNVWIIISLALTPLISTI
jgi:hypothetical protein